MHKCRHFVIVFSQVIMYKLVAKSGSKIKPNSEVDRLTIFRLLAVVDIILYSNLGNRHCVLYYRYMLYFYLLIV